MSELREYVNLLDASSPLTFAKMLREPDQEQEQALRTYLGHESYRRMRGLALQLPSQSSAAIKGRVVLIPDFMGTPLSRVDWNGKEESTPVWMNVSRLMRGEFDLLQLKDDGVTGVDCRFDIVPSGIFKRDYGELLLTLGQNWDIRVLWYDWRKDLRIAASLLESKLREWFGVNQPAHLLGLGMGGLVARWFISEYPDRWRNMQSDLSKGGRMVLIGVPNHGTFLAPQILSGTAEIVHRLVKLDDRRSYSRIVKTFRTFASLYQLIPRHDSFANPGASRLFDAKTYCGDLPTVSLDGNLNDLEDWQASRIPERMLSNVRELSKRLDQVPEDLIDGRTVVISGYGVPTIVELDETQGKDLASSYLVSADGGDGVVPLSPNLARPSIKGSREYFLKAAHTALMSHPRLLSSLSELLESGETKGKDLETDLPELREPRPMAPGAGGIGRMKSADREFWGILDHLSARRGSSETHEPTVEERIVSEGLTRDLAPACPDADGEGNQAAPPVELNIELGLLFGRIDKVDETLVAFNQVPPIPAVDALAVGLYEGEIPTGPALRLDKAISQEFLDRYGKVPGASKTSPDRARILTQFTRRRLIHGSLGHPFFLPDPRMRSLDDALPGRLITVMGMGLPGRFGVPELTVVAQELCWSVGRLGKQHLAVSALGTKDNNLPPDQAISGWVRGIKLALYGARTSGEPTLPRLTIVIDEWDKIAALDEAIRRERDDERAKKGSDKRRNLAEPRVCLNINYTPLFKMDVEPSSIPGIEDEGVNEIGSGDGRDQEPRTEPTRVTLGLSGSTYRYGAIKKGASVPEREVTLRTELVEEICTELSTERDLDMQLERGRFLGKLILPVDLRDFLQGRDPVVMILDNATARIPWEMVALDEDQRKALDSARDQLEPEFYFLGTSRGFTRQLRTTFAPPPEPEPSLKRRLRVLVIADPARDARLPGAELEGTEVADLFEKFNLVHGGSNNSVEVVRMFGPTEAKLTCVLREIMSRPYDVLHFAGHCVYDRENPVASGWLFSDKKRLTANEMRRIDRIPRFIFSNACESGVTPDRTDKRSVELPVTFAESFFAQGVSNFVCTAWPVDDAAARQFAKALYGALLRMGDFAPKPPDSATSGRNGEFPEPETPARSMVMYEAMRYARLATANAPGAARTWGAYQHYGDPFFRLLDPGALSRNQEERDKGPKRGNGDVSSRPGTSPGRGRADTAVVVAGPTSEAAATQDVQSAPAPVGATSIAAGSSNGPSGKPKRQSKTGRES
jgi:hypothetical protein